MSKSEINQPQYKSCSELEALSDNALGEYIASSTFEFDGTSQAVRVALARILQRSPFGTPRPRL